MNNIYHHDIMRLLIKAGSGGMNIRGIARHIYNKHAVFFDDETQWIKIYSKIRFYLWTLSRNKRSGVLRISRGQYALKPDFALQLDIFLDISLDAEETEPTSKRINNAKQLELEF